MDKNIYIGLISYLKPYLGSSVSLELSLSACLCLWAECLNMQILRPAQNRSKVKYPSGVITFLKDGTIFGGRTDPVASGDQFSEISAHANIEQIFNFLSIRTTHSNIKKHFQEECHNMVCHFAKERIAQNYFCKYVLLFTCVQFLLQIRGFLSKNQQIPISAL